MFRLVESLEYKAFQNYRVVCLPYRPFSGKYFQLGFGKARVSTMFTANHINITVFKVQQDFHFFRRLNVSSRLGVASLMHKPVVNFSILDGGVGLNSSYYGASSKHFSSKALAVVNKNDHVGARSAKSCLNASLFNKTWRREKPLETLRKCFEDGTRVAVSEPPVQKANLEVRISSHKDVDVMTSTNQPPGGGMKDASLGEPVSTSSLSNKSQFSTKKSTRRQRSRGDKNKEKLSGATAHSDAVQAKGSERVSPSKRTNNAENGKFSQASENNSAGSALQEVGNSSNLAKQQSRKTSRNSSRKKGKPLEEQGAVKKLDEALVNPGQSAVQVSCKNESPLKQKSHIAGKKKHQAQEISKQLYPPTGKSVVVVESVTKAKVIQGYLGDMYEVLPSYGHVRDLAARSGSVRPDDDFSMVWEVPSAAWTHLKSIKVALSGAENLIVASDPDREGEAIAWHIIEMLEQQGALREDINIARVVFHEITESSIKNALQAPRNIDKNLVNAYLARRALDYLIGFNISPLLWRKLPGCQSAGRVQSAALSLICDREMEIDKFKPQEYWSFGVKFKNGDEPNSFSLQSNLTHFESQKLSQFSISSHAEAKDIENKINSLRFMVVGSKRKKVQKPPPPPYITSTLQQDAANRLHFTATYTMKIAQKLYEGVLLSSGKATGLITYMRTDGLHVSNEAAIDIRSLVIERYGQDFASESAQKHFKKVKNAQEAHEAIRPTDIRRFPSTLTGILDEDSLKLYTLIWSRTMACQMQSASIEQIQIDIGTADKSVASRSTCSRISFRGYQAVYKDVEAGLIRSYENEGNDGEAFEVLSSLKTRNPLHLDKVELKQHHTKPPPHYSEASLVKKLEELGIGRPSTYASTLKVLQDRNYVTVKDRVLHPEFRGRMVSAFLSHHFSEVTNYSFTADMETELDNVSAGSTEWKVLLKDYWTRFSSYCDLAGSVHIHQVEKMLEKTFGDFLFSSLPNESRTCPSCMEGTLIFKVSRFGEGYFIGCDQHPKCKYIARTLFGGDDDEALPQKNTNVEEPKLLGLHPSSSEKVLLKNGPYGFYIQLGEDRKGYLPKRASISQIKDVDSITLEAALELLLYPLTLGNHPEDNQPVVLRIAKNGYSIRHRSTLAAVPKNMKPRDVTLDKALELLVSKGIRRFGRPKSKPKPNVGEVVEAI